MNEFESRLRDALHATADTVDEYKERPLPSHAVSAGTSSRRLIPVLAAVAVLLLLAGALGVRHLLHDAPKPMRKTFVVPKFVVAAMPASKTRPSRLEVREIQGGRLAGSRQIADRRLQFSQVVGSGDGRTFLVVVSDKGPDSCSAEIRRLTLGPSGAIEDIQPTGLSFPFSAVRDLAISPDGRRIAYSRTCAGDQNDMGVYDTVTRAKTTWTIPTPQFVSGLAWTPDGRGLALVVFTPGADPAGGQARLLSPGRASQGDVVSSSSRILDASPGAWLNAIRVGPDGRSAAVYAIYYSKQRAVGTKVITVSLTSGKQSSAVPVPIDRDPMPAVLESEGSGRYLLTQAGVVDLQQGGRIQRIAGLSGALDITW